MPKVSVLMPAYNAGKYIREAVDSILNQTYSDFELIIINDCSQDDTEAIILDYSDPRVVYLKNEKNLGVAATLNKGLDIARGEYIARMDADDIAFPERLKKQVERLDQDSTLVVCGTQLCNFSDGVEAAGLQFPVNKAEAGALLVLHPTVAHPTVMLRACVLRDNGLRYDLTYEGTEDFALWWEISRYGTLGSLEDVLLKYRVHGGQVTQTVKPERVAVFKRFAAKRLRDMGINEDMASALYEYTCDTYSAVTQQETQAFITMLSEILQSEAARTRFDEYALKKVLSRCAMRCIHMAAIPEWQRISMYQFARKRNLLQLRTCIRNCCSRAVRCFR